MKLVLISCFQKDQIILSVLVVLSSLYKLDRSRNCIFCPNGKEVRWVINDAKSQNPVRYKNHKNGLVWKHYFIINENYFHTYSASNPIKYNMFQLFAVLKVFWTLLLMNKFIIKLNTLILTFLIITMKFHKITMN